MYSGKIGSLNCATIISTAWHVYRNILNDLPSGSDPEVSVSLYPDGKKEDLKARLLVFDSKLDLALLIITTERIKPDPVAHVLPAEYIANLVEGTSVYSYGCPLGSEPIHSTGSISSTSTVYDGQNYYMINAPTYFGNSGGGIWHFTESGPNQCPVGFWVGSFSKIYTKPNSASTIAITHMGLFSDPVKTVQFLYDHGFEVNPDTLQLDLNTSKLHSKIRDSDTILSSVKKMIFPNTPLKVANSK